MGLPSSSSRILAATNLKLYEILSLCVRDSNPIRDTTFATSASCFWILGSAAHPPMGHLGSTQNLEM